MASVEDIKQALRSCRNSSDVHRTAGHFRSDVLSLYADPETKVFGIQISNLKKYLLKMMRSSK